MKKCSFHQNNTSQTNDKPAHNILENPQLQGQSEKIINCVSEIIGRDQNSLDIIRILDYSQW